MLAAAAQMVMLLLDKAPERGISDITLQNHAIMSALDEYILKMPLNAQIGALGAENDQFFYQIPSGFFLVQNRPFRCIAEARHGFQ